MPSPCPLPEPGEGYLRHVYRLRESSSFTSLVVGRVDAIAAHRIQPPLPVPGRAEAAFARTLAVSLRRASANARKALAGVGQESPSTVDALAARGIPPPLPVLGEVDALAAGEGHCDSSYSCE